MLKIIAVLISLMFSNAYADSFNIGTLVNYHTLANLPKLHNKLTPNGRLVSSPFFVEFKHNNFSIFSTTECMGQIAVGVTHSTILDQTERNTFSVFVGAYAIQSKKWREESDVQKYWIDASKNIGIIPLIGLRNDFKLLKAKTFSVDFSATVTPAMLQGGLFLHLPID